MRAVSAAPCPLVPAFRVADLSTGHLTEETMQNVQADVFSRARAGAAYEEGCWLFVPEDDDEDEAPSLRAVFSWARANDFEWIRLDADGSRVDALPFYDW